MNFFHINPYPEGLKNDQTDWGLSLLESVFHFIKAPEVIRRQLSINQNQLIVNTLSEATQSIYWDLAKYSRVVIVGAGKASAYACNALTDLLPSDMAVTGCIVSNKRTVKLHNANIQHLPADHPVPGLCNLESTAKLIQILQQCNSDDLIIGIITGGASAMLCAPRASVDLENLQRITRHLLEHKATIDEINQIRIHLSQVKGGGLADICHNSDTAVLLISDVAGDKPEFIGSGPFFAYNYSKESIAKLTEKYRLSHMIPDLSVKKTLSSNRPHYILSNSHDIISALHKTVLKSGFDQLTKELFNGQIDNYADLWNEKIEQLDNQSEYNVTIGRSECVLDLPQKHGKGGRNQHLAMIVLKKLMMSPREMTFFSISSDGDDGNSNAAGAVVNNRMNIDIDFLDECIKTCSSKRFFDQVGGSIKTGDTQSNINDFQVLITQ